ncbi:MAG: hypothetical protein AAFR70_05960, partial [Pseudomonadota bacterium]
MAQPAQAWLARTIRATLVPLEFDCLVSAALTTNSQLGTKNRQAWYSSTGPWRYWPNPRKLGWR